MTVAAEKPPPRAAAVEADASDEPTLLSWHDRLTSAVDEARRRKKPILVRAGAEWCGWCRKLDVEIAKPDVQKELAEWVLVYVDADDNPDDARRMNIGPIPALRILDSNGRTLARREGFLPADKLLLWLQTHGDAEGGDAADDVTDAAELDADAVARLMRQLGHRDADVREAVIRRLARGKGLAAVDVVQTFSRGNLATRLAALELLGGWQAPVQGIDPWQPDTVTEERLNDLKAWADKQAGADNPIEPVAEPLTPEQLDEARNDIAKLIVADTAEMEAIGARLARHGSALLPEVREQRQQADSDKLRERLDWLRFRLAASDALILKWPGGLVRLASTEARIRHAAASELLDTATSGEEALLIELFAHPDPFVRELSLKALHGVGGTRSGAEMSRLLSDPEPNVRAAVLKQMTEKPSPKLVPQIAEYIAKESDPDLIVHAVRLLREIKGKAAVECLIGQLAHSSWQVRAEAVEAIGEIVSHNNRSYGRQDDAGQALSADAYAAILEVLPDQDGFVVSRAVNALKGGDFALAAGPLAKAAEQHPELAQPIGEALTAGNSIRPKALPLLRAWLKHQDEYLRAAALRSLCHVSELDGEKELIPALSDASERVRVAAAEQLLVLCQQQRPGEPSEAFAELEEAGPSSLFGSVLKLFTKANSGKPNSKGEASASDQAAEHSPHEAWLAKFRSGQDRPEWMNKAADPLRQMLNSSSTSEHVAAGLVLVALGEEALALPVLTQAATNQPNSVASVAKSLSWLPWDQRVAFFHRLRALTQDPHRVAVVCDELVVLRDSRASDTLWDVLSGDQTTATLAQSIIGNLQQNHGMNQYSDPPPRPVGLNQEAISRLAREGREWQQRVALAFLLLIEESEAAEAASAVYGNEQASAAVRRDAFCVLLLASPPDESQAAATAALAAPNSVAIVPALAYLTLGEAGVQSMAEGDIHLALKQNHYESRSSEKPALPDEIMPEQLRPLLTSEDENVVAQAGYLLAILGETEGLDRLIKRWRIAGTGASEWEKLVYEAIAASDNPKHVPILDEIYRSMAKDRTYEVRDLYWAIRSMHGPEVLKLRKRIRDEVGMDHLR